jgi:hypothetical protein
LTRLVEAAGGQVIRIRHLADPHSIITSLEHSVGRRTGVAKRLAQLLRLSPTKRLLALGLGTACRLGYGEAIRVSIIPMKV